MNPMFTLMKKPMTPKLMMVRTTAKTESPQMREIMVSSRTAAGSGSGSEARVVGMVRSRRRHGRKNRTFTMVGK